MTPEFVRRWSLRVMVVCAVVAVACLLNEIAVLRKPIGMHSHDLSMQIFNLAFAALGLAVAIHRYVPRWMESVLEEGDRPGAKPDRPRFSWLRFALETLLPVFAVFGLLLPLVLLFLILNRGKELLGGELLLARIGMPCAAITAVHAFVRSRRFVRSASVTHWDRTALMAGPLAVFSLGMLLLVPDQQFEALPGEHPWITLLLTLPFLFDAGYTMLRSGKTRYRSRRAHPSRSGLRKRHA